MNTWATHQIQNQFDELQDYNLFDTDPILQEILQRHQSQDQARLSQLGTIAGSAEYYQYAEQANRYTPELKAFDARGRRCDVIEFHPAWHQWMALNRSYEVHAYPFSKPDDAQGWLIGAEYQLPQAQDWILKAQYSQNATSFKNATPDYEAQQYMVGADYTLNKQVKTYGYAGYLTLEQGESKNKQPLGGIGLEYKF